MKYVSFKEELNRDDDIFKNISYPPFFQLNSKIFSKSRKSKSLLIFNSFLTCENEKKMKSIIFQSKLVFSFFNNNNILLGFNN